MPKEVMHTDGHMSYFMESSSISDYLSWECKKKGVEGDNIRLSGPYSGPDIWSFAKINNNLRLQNSLQGSGENMGSLGIISPGQPSFLQRGPQSLEHRQPNSGPSLYLFLLLL